ncbi:hypothetical protein ACH5RR_018085 [Cinchona calisaya]|uniref:Uncharacterized protein n=1 Tax=Cinchona calisaya TaxID=153742 RepID=A0ABD2ZKF7_9GENT
MIGDNLSILGANQISENFDANRLPEKINGLAALDALGTRSVGLRQIAYMYYTILLSFNVISWGYWLGPLQEDHYGLLTITREEKDDACAESVWQRAKMVVTESRGGGGKQHNGDSGGR